MSQTLPSHPAAERNTAPIGDVLADWLPESGLVLEIASGTGQHTAAFAARFPRLAWQPTEATPAALADIAAWTRGLANVHPPVVLDAAGGGWPFRDAAAMLCINMIHIAPWAAVEGLFAGAGRALAAGGLLFTYGPYKVDGAHTAPSNEQFDRNLRRQNPAWGIRDMADLDALAADAGLARAAAAPMPANNFTLVFRRA